MHYMHYKDYIHHGLAAEKTPPPLPQGGGNHLAGWGGGVGVPAHICIIIHINITHLYSSVPHSSLPGLAMAHGPRPTPPLCLKAHDQNHPVLRHLAAHTQVLRSPVHVRSD